MLFVLVIVLHVLLSFFLIAVILLQGGRGGLGEALGGAAAQSLFGGGVNTVMTRITAVSATLFIVTCLSLAALSTAQGRSVMEKIPAMLPEAIPPLTAPPIESQVTPPAEPTSQPETTDATPPQ